MKAAGSDDWQALGRFRARIAPDVDGHDLHAFLADLPGHLRDGEVIQEGRNRLIRLRTVLDGSHLDLAVKIFGSDPARRLYGRSSKALRSWQAAVRLAEHGLTPTPVACIEEPRRARESYFLTRFADGRVTFRDALNFIYREHPDCEALMRLLQTTADGIRAMHGAGLFHRDLGNQNILLRPIGRAEWADPLFIDLNRARLPGEVPIRARARDLSRITLPSDFLRVFFQMVHEGPAPASFLRWERHYRTRFAWHTRTRALRHPLRETRGPRQPTYPAPRDIWIWDERSGQAISAWTSRDRRRLYPGRAYLPVAIPLLRALPAVRRAAREHLREAFRTPVDLAGRIGVAVQMRPETGERETERLRELGTPPVLLRFYHHESEVAWSQTADAVRRLHVQGHRVTVALVQDRRAVRDPARWKTFLHGVTDAIHDAVEAIEIGHAVNRVKWGVWSPAEYCGLIEPAVELMARHRGIDWLGPAGIDAEFPRVLALMQAVPAGVRFSALSHHLYVDRRGAPENRQGRSATLEKTAYARALADVSPGWGKRLVISEVNWPLLHTGVYSPVGSPYNYPGEFVGAPNVDENRYADYMLRYLLITLCSGLAERVFWWRLAAHGYGLIDDRTEGGWRPRRAFEALSFFLRTTGDARFIRKEDSPDGVTTWHFEKEGRRHRWVYAHPAAASYRPPTPIAGICNAVGQPVETRNGAMLLTGSPVLVREE